MKTTILFLKKLFLLVLIFSCSNNTVKKRKLKNLQGRYLFLEYYFKTQGEGENYSVNAAGNGTYWIIRNDSIFEEYFIKKNNTLVYDYDFVDQIKFLEKDNFKLFDTLVTSIKLSKDTLVMENDFFRYKLLKEYKN